MRALRYDGSKAVLDPRADTPVPTPAEALIRPTRGGLPALALGGPAREPVTIGSEFAGIVESLGEGAERDLRKRCEGKRVAGSPDVVCGKCDMCRGGLPVHCRARTTMGVSRPGCLAERFTLPLRNLVEIPATVTDDQAIFAGALGGALHAATIVRIEGKPYVTILGDGVDALLCAQVMVRLNASVRVLGNRPEKFTLCEKWGIKHRHSSEVGRRHDQDIVIDCTGAPGGLALAMALVRPRGKIVLRATASPQLSAASRASALSTDKPLDLSPLIEHEIEILGSRTASLAEAIARLAAGDIDVLPLITKRVKFADAVSAVALASEPDQLKVMVEM